MLQILLLKMLTFNDAVDNNVYIFLYVLIMIINFKVNTYNNNNFKDIYNNTNKPNNQGHLNKKRISILKIIYIIIMIFLLKNDDPVGYKINVITFHR